MVVKLIKWPLSSKKFEVGLVIKRLEGLGGAAENEYVNHLLTAEVKWKGLKKKMLGFGSLIGVKRDRTSVGVFDEVNGAFCWNEEFRNSCSFLGFKEFGLHSWEVLVTVVNGWSQDSKNKALVVGTASLNLGEYVSSGQVKDIDISIPLTLDDKGKGSAPLLMISLSLIEVKCAADASEPLSGSVGVMASSSVFALSPDIERVTAKRKEGKKATLFKGCVTAPKLDITPLKVDNGGNILKDNQKSDFDTDSIEDINDGILDDSDEQVNMLQPLSYGPLTYVNFGHSAYTGDVDDWVYYSNRKPHANISLVDDAAMSVQDSSVRQIPRHRFLSWRKRKLGFRSTKPKGEPLLKKDCRDEGGDDIDFDRRQLTSSDESSYGWSKTEDGSTTSRSSFSEFEDEGFSVGIWEKKDITCRDGHMKLETQVFFASMDQRSERAAGESACTALVTVIAEWLQTNRYEMPIKSQFDRLIRDGSSEWRHMCEAHVFKERFPDKHFDLETVLEAKIRPLAVVPEKSYIGFFHPEGILEDGCFDILRGSMSFDEIWDEISRQASECDLRSNPLVYIVSWNDHFFILKVEQDAYYIIDTLGERLFEGCSQAYILRFDHDTVIKQIPTDAEALVEASGNQKVQLDRPQQVSRNEKPNKNLEEMSACGAYPACTVLVSSGKESCKEYIKSFLAAIPIRQLETDIKKGLTSSIRLHQRLQIEFHFTDIIS